MISLFQSQIEYVHQQNMAWIAHLRKLDLDLPWEVKRTLSKILNSSHIIGFQLLNKEPESELEDLIPEMHWEKLEQHNFQIWSDFFASCNASEDQFAFQYSPFIFMHLRNNATYLGELKLLLKQHQIPLLDDQLFTVR
ncbi:MAG TPA: hypothetical protein PLI97_00715 [Fluviicola sp.]|nr:hypothetical protein [Fluviicola sp.]